MTAGQWWGGRAWWSLIPFLTNMQPKVGLHLFILCLYPLPPSISVTVLCGWNLSWTVSMYTCDIGFNAKTGTWKFPVWIKIFSSSCWAPVAHAYNPSYLGSWDQEGCDSRSAWTNSLQELISKTARAKWTGGVAQVVERLLCKCKALRSTAKNNNKKLAQLFNCYIVFHFMNILLCTYKFFCWQTN
jgi:hypothetical protein